jgi:hypothetical protein
MGSANIPVRSIANGLLFPRAVFYHEKSGVVSIPRSVDNWRCIVTDTGIDSR